MSLAQRLAVRSSPSRCRVGSILDTYETDHSEDSIADQMALEQALANPNMSTRDIENALREEADETGRAFLRVGRSTIHDHRSGKCCCGAR